MAALAVYFHHNVPQHISFEALGGTVAEMHVGVTVFFVLSGFLITYRYFDNYQFTRRWWRDYTVARVARIYPMYFLLTLVTFAVNGQLGNIKLLVANLTFARGFFSDIRYSGIAQGWTLTVEECFYFSAPLLWLLRKWIPLLAQTLLILGSGYLMVYLFGPLDWHGFYRYYHFMLHYTFQGRCFEFTVGMLLAIHLTNRPCPWRINFTYLGLLGMALALWLMAQFRVPPHPFGGNHPWGMRINNFLLPLFVVMFFYGLIHERTLVRRLLATRWMELLGFSSYIFYLIHMGFVNDFFKSSPYTSGLLVRLVLLTLVSIGLYRWVEKPINDGLRRWNRQHFRGPQTQA